MKKLKPFSYFQSSSVEEAHELLDRYGEEARVFAGGTDALVLMKQGLLSPKVLVDIKSIPGLGKIEDDDGSIEIGALAKINHVAASSLVKREIPLLQQAAESLGTYQIRNLATIGGNICNASPAADMIPALLCLDASATFSQDGEKRTLPVENLFVGPRETVLVNKGILTKITIPKHGGKMQGVYLKHTFRKALDLAIVGVAVQIEKRRDEVARIRIGLGGVSPTPIRARRTEEFLEKSGFTDKTISEASRMILKEISPISDVRASAEY